MNDTEAVALLRHPLTALLRLRDKTARVDELDMTHYIAVIALVMRRFGHDRLVDQSLSIAASALEEEHRHGDGDPSRDEQCPGVGR